MAQAPRSAPPLPHSHAVRSACGLTSFLGLLSVDGVLLEANHSASTPPEFSLHDALGRPFWEAAWWSWSPSVQELLRGAVARAGIGRVMRYPETALVRRNQLITVDLVWLPIIRATESRLVPGTARRSMSLARRRRHSRRKRDGE